MNFSRLRRSVISAAGCCLLLMTGCALGPAPDSGNSTAESLVTDPSASPIPHRDHLTVGYCADGTYSVPMALFTAANHFVADSIDQAVTLNQGGLTVYVTYVSAHPYLSQNTLTITVPPLPAPPTPHLAPTPAPNSNDVFGSSAAQSTVTAANAQAAQTYRAQVNQLAAQLAATQAQVKQQTNRLRTLPRPAGAEANQTSLWGCVELQAQRMDQATGKKLLLIESDFEDNRPADAMSVVRLDGVVVDAIFMNCHSGADCSAKQATWGTVFQRMHAASWHFYDPGASASLPNPLLAGA